MHFTCPSARFATQQVVAFIYTFVRGGLFPITINILQVSRSWLSSSVNLLHFLQHHNSKEKSRFSTLYTVFTCGFFLQLEQSELFEWQSVSLTGRALITPPISHFCYCGTSIILSVACNWKKSPQCGYPRTLWLVQINTTIKHEYIHRLMVRGPPRGCCIQAAARPRTCWTVPETLSARKSSFCF